MGLSPEALYLQLRQLVGEMPDLTSAPNTPESFKWLGRAIMLVETAGKIDDIVHIKAAAQNLTNPLAIPNLNVQTIATIVYATLAKAEQNAPAAMHGSFLPAGKPFDTLMSVSKVLGQAKSDVLFIDAYADEKLLMDFAALAPGPVRIRVLTSEQHKPSLKSAARRWVEQYGSNRPLEIRVAQPRMLHDRHIMLDGSAIWNLGQSFNALADHSPTAIEKTIDPRNVEDKIATYEEIWGAAVPLPAV